MNTIGKEFQLLKEILRKIKYSYKAILTLLIAMVVAFVTTMMRPLIVSCLTDYGLADGG